MAWKSLISPVHATNCSLCNTNSGLVIDAGHSAEPFELSAGSVARMSIRA